MDLGDYVTQIFPVECKGRDIKGNDVLEQPTPVNVTISKSPDSSMLSSTVACFYNTGAHGERCKASHPNQDKKYKNGITCPYSFDIPFALEKKSRD
jgi:hypothetical protein